MRKTRTAAKARHRFGRRVEKTDKRRGQEIRIGISGWRCAGWRAKFYPKGGRRGDRGNLEITLSYPPERAAGEFSSHRARRPLLDLNVLSGKATEID